MEYLYKNLFHLTIINFSWNSAGKEEGGRGWRRVSQF